MRHVLQKTAGAAALLLLSLLVCEGVLRVLPSPIQYPAIQEFDDPASLLGVELVPHAVQRFRGACFGATVSTNALGWRDRERTVERVPGKTRIAVLGDSFMEGTHVNDDETMARQLESLLGPDKTEVLNFGLSSIGTVQEEILYDKIVSGYRPDIVLVAFYSNDVQNSDPILDGGESGVSRLTFRSDDGSLLNAREERPLFGARRWLRTHSALFRLVKAAYGQLRRIASTEPSTPDAPAGLPPSFGVYGPPRDAEWERAWRSTEDALVRLQKRVGSNAELIVFSIPEVLQLAPDVPSLVRKEYGVDPPEGFDPRYPHDRLQALAARRGIRTIDLLPGFLAERDLRHLDFPYFSFPCDGHWSALGHRTAANVLAAVLQHSTVLRNGRREPDL